MPEEMRAGIRVPDETDETTPALVTPPDAPPVASCDGCDAIDRRLLSVEDELLSVRAAIAQLSEDDTSLATRLGRLQNHLLGAGKAQ